MDLPMKLFLKQLSGFCLFAASLALTQVALAQAPSVTSALTASRVELVDGKSVLKPAAKVKPGDVLEYSATYVNAGKTAVERVQATLPIPAGTALLADTAKPANAQASTDSLKFAAMPLKRIVKSADGTSREKLVPLADYRALRWEIGTLAAGKDAVVSLRVRVDPLLGATAAKP